MRRVKTASPRHRIALLLLALALALLPGGLRPAPAGAATCQVTTTAADGGAGSLRALAANPGCATITFAAGITQVPLVTPLEIARSVTLLGAGADKLTLIHVGPPGGVGIPGFPTGNVLTIRAGTVSLRGMTITGGLNLGSWGGALTVIGGPGAPVDLTLDGVVVDRNAALGGGGIYASNASLLLYDTTLSNNGTASVEDPSYGGGGLFLDDYWGSVSAYMVRPTIVGNGAGDNGGGGIRVWHRASVGYARLTVVDGTIGTAAQPNTASRGGGIAVNGGQATLIRTVVGGNRASYGGGLYANARGTAYALDSTIDGNRASSQGGGFYGTDSGRATLTNSTISANTANYGGGLALISSGSATLTNSTVSANRANYSEGGSGIHVEASSAYLNFVTVTGNSGGYGVASSSGMVAVGNSIVVGNLAGDCFRFHPGDLVSQGANVWGELPACPASSGLPDRSLSTLHLGIGAVLNPLLADNGGPTKTHNLVAGSPAINNGDRAHCLGTDQRGAARPQGGGCDSGAVETALPPPPPPSPSPLPSALPPSPSPLPSPGR